MEGQLPPVPIDEGPGAAAAPPEGAAPAGAPPGPLWHPVWRVLLYLVLGLGAQVVVGALGVAVGMLLGIEALSPQALLGGQAEGTLFFTVATAPFIVLLTYLFVRFLDRRELGSIGARWPAGGPPAVVRQAVWSVAGTLALLGLWLWIVDLAATVRVAGLAADIRSGPAWWPGAPGALVLVLLCAGFLVQGGLEEWMVRGYVYRALKDRWRWWAAAIASSLLFALLHALNPDVSWVGLLNTFLIGFLFAAIVERTGSLWAVVIIHGVWNFVLACIASLPVSGMRIYHLLDVSVEGPELLTGSGYGPEASLLLTALLVPLLVAATLGRSRA